MDGWKEMGKKGKERKDKLDCTIHIYLFVVRLMIRLRWTNRMTHVAGSISVCLYLSMFGLGLQ